MNLGMEKLLDSCIEFRSQYWTGPRTAISVVASDSHDTEKIISLIDSYANAGEPFTKPEIELPDTSKVIVLSKSSNQKVVLEYLLPHELLIKGGPAYLSWLIMH
jgi:hypothetical protein